MANLFGSGTLSPVDVAMMLSSRNVPYLFVAGEIPKNKNQCVFIFTSSSILDSCRKVLSTKEGVAVLLDIDNELERWTDIKKIESTDFLTLTADKLEEILSGSFGKIQLGLKSKKIDQILLSLETADKGALKDILSFLYSIKNVEMREKIKQQTLSWLMTSNSAISLLNKILPNLPKLNDSTKVKLTNFETALSGKDVSKLRDAFKAIRSSKLSSTEAAEQFQVEEFEILYIQKYIDRSASQ